MRLLLAVPIVLAPFAVLRTSLPLPTAVPPALACSFEPAGPVTIAIDEVQTFFISEGASCTDVNVTITPANGTAGFSSGTACTLTYVTPAGVLFKIRACANGSVTATVREGSTVVQTISVSTELP